MLPLEGITVVSMEQAVAAPFATRQLADLGARVIKIERESGDLARTYDFTVGGDSSFFVWLNRSKESVVLDVKSPEGNRAIKKLIEEADVFVSNLKPGAIDRLGLGAKQVQKNNPGLIHVSISGFGPGGPYTEKKAYDLIVQCEAGMLSVTGTRDVPCKVGPSVADISAGMYAFSSILASLLSRGNTGVGAVHEISMLETLGEWMSQQYLFTKYGGKIVERNGASHASIAPYGPFPTKDGQVFFGLQNEREWEGFSNVVLEDPSLATDPRFTPNAARLENREELLRIIEAKTSQMTSADLIDRLEQCNIATARLRDMSEFADHPQLKARNRWREAVTSSGTTAQVLLPNTLPVGVEPNWGRVPRLGEHTEDVLAEFGLSS